MNTTMGYKEKTSVCFNEPKRKTFEQDIPNFNVLYSNLSSSASFVKVHVNISLVKIGGYKLGLPFSVSQNELLY